jgi:ABC-2 type transport system permease protein
MKLLDMIAKDLLRSIRSRFALGMMIGAPLVIAGLLYFALGSARGDMPAIRVGIVNLDSLPGPGVEGAQAMESPLGKSIRDMFFDPSVKSWIRARDYSGEAEARKAVEARQVDAAVVVPPRFTEGILAGRLPGGELGNILILSDPTLSIAPKVVRSMIDGLMDGVRGGAVAFKALSRGGAGLAPGGASAAAAFEEYRLWYAEFQRELSHDPARAAIRASPPPGGGAGDAIRRILSLVMAGQLLFFAFYTGGYSMLSILREEEEGSLARLFTTPTSRVSILGAKFLSVIATLILQGLVLVALGSLLFHVDWGRPASAALAFGAQVVAAAGLGVLLIALVKSSRQAGPVLGGVLTGLGMLGGLITVAAKMPPSFEKLGLITPQGWTLRAWRLAMSGAAPAELLFPALVAAAMGIAMFVAGAALFRRRFDAGAAS